MNRQIVLAEGVLHASIFQVDNVGAMTPLGNVEINTLIVPKPTTLPLLAIRRASATELELSWPDDGGTWRVQQQAGLAPAEWADQPGTPALAAGSYSLRVPISDPVRFYRPAKP